MAEVDDGTGVDMGEGDGDAVADGETSACEEADEISGAVVAMGSGVERGVGDAVAEDTDETEGADTADVVSAQPVNNKTRSRANASKRPPAPIFL